MAAEPVSYSGKILGRFAPGRCGGVEHVWFRVWPRAREHGAYSVDDAFFPTLSCHRWTGGARLCSRGLPHSRTVLLHGVAEAWVLNKSAPPAYLFGKIRNGGWWYFFLAALVLKAPIPFLILFLIGTWFALHQAKDHWVLLAPSLAVFAVLFSTVFVRYNAGLRHVLVLFPLMAIVAGYGMSAIAHLDKTSKNWATAVVATMVIWQGASSFQSRRDYIAYFNALGRA